jgi:hypothetical protein
MEASILCFLEPGYDTSKDDRLRYEKMRRVRITKVHTWLSGGLKGDALVFRVSQLR